MLTVGRPGRDVMSVLSCRSGDTSFLGPGLEAMSKYTMAGVESLIAISTLTDVMGWLLCAALLVGVITISKEPGSCRSIPKLW